MNTSFESWKSSYIRNRAVRERNELLNIASNAIKFIGMLVLLLGVFTLTSGFGESENVFMRVLFSWMLPIITVCGALAVTVMTPELFKQAPLEDDNKLRSAWALAHGLDLNAVLPHMREYLFAGELIFTQRDGDKLKTYRISKTGELYDHEGVKVPEQEVQSFTSEQPIANESDKLWQAVVPGTSDEAISETKD